MSGMKFYLHECWKPENKGFYTITNSLKSYCDVGDIVYTVDRMLKGIIDIYNDNSGELDEQWINTNKYELWNSFRKHFPTLELFDATSENFVAEADELEGASYYNIIYADNLTNLANEVNKFLRQHNNWMVEGSPTMCFGNVCQGVMKVQ